MAGVSDQDHDATLCEVALPLSMDLGDQRTGRIEYAQAARFRLLFHPARDSMCAEDGDRAGGHFRQMFDEARALGAQTLNHMAVVHDFVPNVDGRPEPRQRLLDDIDRADDTGAEAARLREDHVHWATFTM